MEACDVCYIELGHGVTVKKTFYTTLGGKTVFDFLDEKHESIDEYNDHRILRVLQDKGFCNIGQLHTWLMDYI